MSDSWRDSEGQVIDGRFPLVKHLGGSDHSVVFSTKRGTDKNEKAAIKFIQADAANADAQLARWDRAAKFHHPNVIKVFESGRCQLAGMDLLYVVTEFAQENLGEFLPQRALSAEEAHDMLEPFVDALWYLHGQGFAHGRIKPANILAIDDQLKLSSDSICPDGDKQIGAGKPDIYVAPETNGRTTTAAGDVWSLGATIVESLTQRRPAETSGDPTFPDILPQPYLDIARNTLRRDPKARWTVTEISKRFNPNAAPHPTTAAITEPAPTSAKTANVAPPSTPAPVAARPAPASIAIAEPPKPTPSKSAGMTAAAASASAATGAAVAVAPLPSRVEPKAVPLAKPTKSIDPLSVPLSNVEPHFDAGESSNKGWYIAILLLLAAAAGAWYYVPQVREFVQSIVSPSQSAAPSAQPTLVRAGVAAGRRTSSAACQQHPPKPVQLHQQRSLRLPSQLADHGGIDGPAQVSSNQPPASATPASTPASERTPVKNRTPRPHQRSTHHRRRLHAASRNFAHRSHRINEPARRPGYARHASEPDHAGHFCQSAQHHSRHRPSRRQSSRGQVRRGLFRRSRFFAQPLLQRCRRASRETVGLHSRENFRPARPERMARTFRLHVDRHESSAVPNQAVTNIRRVQLM